MGLTTMKLLPMPRVARAKINQTFGLAVGQWSRYRKLQASLKILDWSAAEVEAWQLEEVRRLLTHAGKTVPYWREVFRETGFAPGDMRAVSDLAALPITTKAMLREDPDRFISDDFDKSKLKERRTGGSTGEPMLFYCTFDEYETQLAHNMRSLYIAGVKPGEPHAKLWGYKKEQVLANRVAPLTGRLFFNAWDATPERMDKWLDHMDRIRPVSIYGYASALHEFAQHAARVGRQPQGLRVALSTAEKLYAGQRRDIAEGLGATVIDCYGSTEVPRLASEHPDGYMYWMSDAAAHEFVADTSAPDADPRMLLTSLQAWAMPLIRYDIGDNITLLDEPDAPPPSLPFPRIGLGIGRTLHVFALPNDQRINSYYFYQRLFPLERVAQFQIQHLELGLIRIVIIAKEGEGRNAVDEVKGAVAGFVERYGDSVELQVDLVEDIERTARGKRPLMRSWVAEDKAWSPESNPAAQS